MRLPAPWLPPWLERELPFPMRYRVRVGGMRMHLMEAGAGRPVLMLHGNPTWGFLWRKVARSIIQRCVGGAEAGAPPGGVRLVVPDLMGLGFSDKPSWEGAHTLAQHGRWVGELIDLLELDDVVLVAQDWGGPIGLRAFVERPRRLAGLVLSNTVVGPPRPGFRPSAFHRFARWPCLAPIVFRWLGFPEIAMPWAQGDPKSLPPSVLRAYRYPLRRVADRIAPLALARMVPDGPEHPTVPDLRRTAELATSFGGPVALVWGERDPVLGRVVGHLERTLPSAAVTRTSAGHFLQEEVPETLAAAVLDVARRLDAGTWAALNARGGSA